MLVHCTDKASKCLKIKPPDAPAKFDPLYSWRLNIIEKRGRRLVIFMNDASRYGVALGSLKIADLKNLQNLFTQMLRNVMLNEQFNPDLIDLYLKNAGSFEYVRNSNKQMTSCMVKNSEPAVSAHYAGCDDIKISRVINHNLVSTKEDKDFWYPIERFCEKLAPFGLPVKRCRAFRFAVRLRLVNGWVYRELLVPTDITFKHFRRIIDAAYDWHGYKFQFNFMFYKDVLKHGNKPDFMLYEQGDPSSFIENSKPITDKLKLSDYVPHYKYLQYFYDYVDSWQHFIELIEIVEDCTENLPMLLSGKGDAPCDRVGGAKGFADILEKLKSANSYERMKLWDSLKYGISDPFDFERISARVKYSVGY